MISSKKTKMYSIEISQLPNVYATPYFFKKFIHLLKVKGNVFDMLIPAKSCLSRPEDIARHAT